MPSFQLEYTPTETCISIIDNCLILPMFSEVMPFVVTISIHQPAQTLLLKNQGELISLVMPMFHIIRAILLIQATCSEINGSSRSGLNDFNTVHKQLAEDGASPTAAR